MGVKTMDEDDIQSHQKPSLVSEAAPLTSTVPPPSPSQQPSNGRLTVAAPPPATAIPVAIAATAVAAPAHTLTLALPIQAKPGGAAHGGSGHGGSGHGGGGHGREDCWSEGATATLIDAWGERYLELNRGNLKQKHWKDVADAVSSREDYTKPAKTDIQCKNRLDTLKKKYKLEKAKILNGAGASKWAFFHKLDHLIGQARKNTTVATATAVAIPLPSSKPSPTPIRQLHPNQHHHLIPGSDRNSASSKSGPSRDSTDSFPPETVNGKKRKFGDNPMGTGIFRGAGVTGAGSGPLRELTRAILKFGEVYERVESSKLQHIMELEKQRMNFTKEVELQRMQFFMKTQLELTQMKYGKVGNNNSNNTD